MGYASPWKGVDAASFGAALFRDSIRVKPLDALSEERMQCRARRSLSWNAHNVGDAKEEVWMIERVKSVENKIVRLTFLTLVVGHSRNHCGF